MNKQEFIERMKSLKNLFGNKSEYVEIDAVIELASELDEPQKVTVPQFVADWIEYAKFEDYHLLGAMDSIAISGRKDLDEWFRGDDDNMDIFARAWLDGYEVKKEKRYLVKMKSLGTNFSFLNLNKTHNHWMFSSKNECDIYQVRHTRKELEEAGFGEVFNSPLFEVEEVE